MLDTYKILLCYLDKHSNRIDSIDPDADEIILRCLDNYAKNIIESKAYINLENVQRDVHLLNDHFKRQIKDLGAICTITKIEYMLEPMWFKHNFYFAITVNTDLMKNWQSPNISDTQFLQYFN